MSEIKSRLVNGLFKENPTFVLMLGMCPTLAVTTSAMNGADNDGSACAQQYDHFPAAKYHSG